VTAFLRFNALSGVKTTTAIKCNVSVQSRTAATSIVELMMSSTVHSVPSLGNNVEKTIDQLKKLVTTPTA
jgi:hypothetical protein